MVSKSDTPWLMPKALRDALAPRDAGFPSTAAKGAGANRSGCDIRSAPSVATAAIATVLMPAPRRSVVANPADFRRDVRLRGGRELSIVTSVRAAAAVDSLRR